MINNLLRGCRFIKVAKKEKIPVESDWQTFNNYDIDDLDLQDWINKGNNVGVATGFNNLLVVDFDDEEFQKEYLHKLPQTLMQKSGSGLYHLFFKTDTPMSLKIQDNDKKTLADIQGKGKQIIINPSIHPNGNTYQFINNEKIATIKFSELQAIFSKYLIDKKLSNNKYKNLDKPDIRHVLSQYGVDTSKNPTSCPWHNSKSGKCFSWCENKQLFNCFHCGKGGDVISFIQEHEDCSFSEACKILDIEIEKTSKKENISVNELGKKRIELNSFLKADPHALGQIIGDQIKKQDNLFYRPLYNDIVEVNVINSATEQEQTNSKVKVIVVKEDRFYNIVSKYLSFYTKREKSGEFIESDVSLSRATISVLLKNETMLHCLRKLDKVLTYPYLFRDSEGLQVECKGYSEKTHIYFTKDTPVFIPVPVEEAKKELDKILSGFCFGEDEDKEMAYAYILTPALRGLFNDKRERTPCFAILANRERAGKDYLAGVRSLIYKGVAIDNAPISDGERSNVEEWRKKFTTMLINGETLFHSANNTGYLNNPVFEALITSKVYKDRLLGSNTEEELDNYIDFSFSANMGLRWRGDVSGRLRRIQLFYDEEDPNSREFPIPDLQGYVLENRSRIVSCIYSLIIDWFNAGSPKQDGKVFTSFPIWARICGAIMDYHNLGDPLVHQEDDETSGNLEEHNMKEVYILMYHYQQVENKISVKSTDIIKEIENYQMRENDFHYAYREVSEDILNQIPIISKGDKLNMGKLITKFRGRILGGIKMQMLKNSKQAKNRLYNFELVNK